MTIKVHYFAGLRGRADPICLLLEDQQVSYTENRVEGKDWPNLKPNYEFGQLPVLEDGDLTIPQSQAIMRYLGRKYKLYGKDEKEAIRCDVAQEACNDAREELSRLWFDPEFDSKRENYTNTQLKSRLALLEKFFQANPSKSKEFWVGDSVTFVDYLMWNYLDMVRAFALDTLKSYENLYNFYEKFKQRPNLSKYLTSDKRPALFMPPFAKFGGTKETS